MSYDLRDQLREVAVLIDDSQTPIHGADIRAGAVDLASASDEARLPMRRVTIAAGAFAVVMIIVGGVAWLSPFGDSAPPADSGPRVTDTIFVGLEIIGSGALPVATEGAVWVGGSTVARIDSSTRQVTDTIRVGARATTLFAAPDAVWAVAENVSRIDLGTREVTDTIEIGELRGAAVIASGALWVSSHNKGLIEIDLATRQIIKEHQIPVPPRTSANDFQIVDPTFAAWWADEIDGAIWFWVPNELIRFELESREFTAVIDVGDIPISEECCIATDDAIWLVSNPGDVWRFDLDTLEITDKLDLNGAAAGIAAEGAIWIPSGDNESVYRIDQTTREVTDVIPAGANPTKAPVFADGAIWVPSIRDRPNDDIGTITRIDTETLQVTHTFEVGDFPWLPISYDGAIWIPTHKDGTLTRIQTR